MRFGGDVYPKTLPNGETEYCVSGSCNACDSKWRDDLVNDWKEEVCCEERGKEPNASNDICLSPKHSEPSSSSHEPESSSSNDWPYSSSEKQEDADCYLNDLEANAAYDGKVWKCIQAGNIPNFRLDSRRCIAGECMERSSSSEGASSSSSDYSDNTCLASKPLLQKEEADIYDDWVYMGKEAYGSRKTNSASFKPGTKFFDVLGRAYDKMKARIQFFFRNKAFAPPLRKI